MSWPPQNDTPPEPPTGPDGRPQFTPLVMLAMRMGWITNMRMASSAGTWPSVMAPFEYIAAWEHPTNDAVYVFGVVRGEAVHFTEPKTLFPTDGFIGRLKLLS